MKPENKIEPIEIKENTEILTDSSSIPQANQNPIKKISVRDKTT